MLVFKAPVTDEKFIFVYFIELTIRNVKRINHNSIEDYSYLAFWIIVENFRNRIQSSSEPDSLNLNELETFEG